MERLHQSIVKDIEQVVGEAVRKALVENYRNKTGKAMPAMLADMPTEPKVAFPNNHSPLSFPGLFTVNYLIAQIDNIPHFTR